jgi:dTDP-4-dehydrorhamnose reductase
MVNAARAGKPLKVVSDQTGCPTWTDDLADMTLGLVDRGASGIWHATNSGQTTWFDFTAAILEEFGLQAALSPTTSAEWFKIRPDSAVRPAYSVLDTEPLSRTLGRPVRHWREALREYRRQVDEARSL